jgi:hypothetical protein
MQVRTVRTPRFSRAGARRVDDRVGVCFCMLAGRARREKQGGKESNKEC